MAATVDGGKKAAKTIAKRYGVDKDGKILHYKTAGAKGGSKTHAQGAKPKGFAANKKLARLAGAKGGRISKCRPAKKVSDD